MSTPKHARLETRRAYRTKCAVVKGQLHGKPLFQSRRIRTCHSVAVFQTIGRSLHGREGDSTAARPIYPLCFRKSAFPPLTDSRENVSAGSNATAPRSFTKVCPDRACRTSPPHSYPRFQLPP